jgi:C4-dicarboxylate transporter, DctM subunit
MFGIPENISIWIITGLTATLFVTGAPIFLCIAFWAVMASIVLDFTLSNIGATSYTGLSSYALLAMPLFILTGDLIGAGGIASKLANLFTRLTAPFRGGLAIASIFTCSAFAAISGSNSATVATIGRIMIPELKEQGYHPEFASTAVAAGGIVGILIPPSILMIVYGFTVNVSVLDLFVGGIGPGLLVSMALATAAVYWSRKFDWGKPQPFSGKAVALGVWDAKLGLGAVFIILFIIYGGISSPTEASAIAAFYCLIAGTLLARQLKIKDVPSVFLSSGRVNGLLAPVIAISIVLQQVFSILGVQAAVADFVLGFGSTVLIMLAMMLMIVLFGSIMESISVTIVLAPILAPIAAQLGFDPIHFGLIFVVGLSLGFVTPPFGLDLFVVSGITGIPYGDLLKWLPPFLICILIAWLLVAFVPAITLFLL